jgi:hypothetical protein
MKQSSIEWIYNNLKSHFEHDGDLLEAVKMSFEQAKEMHKEEIVDAINKVSENNVKYANMIIASWSQIEGELFMHNTKLAEQYYNETFNTKEK